MAQLVLKEKVKLGVVYKDFYMRLDDVRVSFPHLDKPYKGKDDDKDKKGAYGIVAMLENKRHADLIEAVKGQISAIIRLNEAGKISADRRFFRDGEDGGREEYEGHWTVSAREYNRPSVRTADGTPLDPRENPDDLELIKELIYGGCYCDVLIRIWYQDGVKVGKGYGKRINAGLVGVKFRRDGESFGEGRIDDSDAWGEDDDAPAPRRKKAAAEDDDDDIPPPRRKKAPVDDDDDEPAPRRKKAPVDDDDDEPAPRRRKPPVDDDDDEPAPRRKKAPVDDDDDEPAPRRRKPSRDDDDDL